MTTGLPIQYTTLDRRTPVFTSDPLSVPDSDGYIGLAVDRTVPSGLNFQPADAEIQFGIESSLDEGITWQSLASAGTQGGIIFYHGTKKWYTINGAITSLPENTGRLARAVVSTSSDLLPAFPVAFTGVLVTDASSFSFPQ